MALERLISSTAGLATPALVVDAAAADRNIAAADVRLRPHFKAHKRPQLMRRQLAGGDCTGVTCATAWEAEVAARAGLHDDILVANEVADPGGLESLRRAAAHARITVAIDSPRHVALLRGIECAVLIEIDVGQQRCGRDPADEAAIVALAERVQATPGLTFRGLQGYEGHAVLLPERPSREEQVARAAAILNRLRTVLDCELVSGGGTGTYDLSTHLDEIQAGSYVLMDTAYGKLALPFVQALWVWSTVISVAPAYAVADCGLKSLGMDHGNPTVTGGSVWFCSDEHTTFGPEQPLAVGDRVRVAPAHIDPTIAYHERMYLVAGEDVLETWPVDLRGW